MIDSHLRDDIAAFLERTAEPFAIGRLLRHLRLDASELGPSDFAALNAALKRLGMRRIKCDGRQQWVRSEVDFAGRAIAG
jgi:hypothetical protein